MRQRGFTLLEVMFALALMGFALVVLIKSSAQNISSSEEAHMMGIATDLARGKMYDIEETLLKDGFTDTDQSSTSEKCFEDEGWPTVCYTFKVEEPKLPSFDELQAMAQKQKGGMGSGFGSSFGSGFGSGGFGSDGMPAGLENSPLGGMIGMMGMFGGGKQDITAAQGGSLIQNQFSMFQEILKVSVRKVTLNMKWKVLGKDREMKVVAFFTDAAAMDKVLSGMGSQELPDNSTGGTGTGSGKSTTGGGGGRPSGGSSGGGGTSGGGTSGGGGTFGGGGVGGGK